MAKEITSKVEKVVLNDPNGKDDFYWNTSSGNCLHLALKGIQGYYTSTDSFYEILATKINDQIQNMPSFYYGHSLSEVKISQDYPYFATMAIMVRIGNYYYLVKRNDDIYELGMPLEQQVNLNKLDCLIASRVFIPSNSSNEYGLFGKADKTRANQKAYKNLNFRFTVTDYNAIEDNLDKQDFSGEVRTMYCCNMEIFNVPKEFIKDLEDSKNIIKIPVWEYEEIIKKGTAKVDGCIR